MIMTAEDFYNRRGFSKNTDRSYSDKLYEIINNSQVTDITSRDQIINPYEILDSTQYLYSGRGHALYDEDLNTLIAIQKQQQAAYDEWYDSASQQALRQREAGLNPDLLGNIDSGSVASTEPLSGVSPMEDTPNELDVVNSAITGISSLVNSSAQVAALPSTFAQAKLAGAQSQLIGSQFAGQELNNLKSFEGLVYNAAAGRFADAASSAATGTPFDVDKFFSPESDSFAGIFEAYAPEDNPRYRAAYEAALKNVQKIKGEGYKLSGDVISNQTSFAEALSNPYFDSNLLSQVAIMEPIMKFQEDVRILNMEYQKILTSLKSDVVSDVDAASAAGAINAEQTAKTSEANYKSTYFENFKGDEAALYDMYQKKFTALRSRATGDIYDNQWSIWKKDPLSERGLAASYFITNAEHMKWYEFLAAYGVSSGAAGNVVDSLNNTIDESFAPIYGTPSDDPNVYKFGRWMDRHLE